MSNQVLEVVSRGGEVLHEVVQAVVKAVVVSPQTPGKSWDSPASTEEVLSQVQRHLKRNSELYSRGDSPEPEDLK